LKEGRKKGHELVTQQQQVDVFLLTSEVENFEHNTITAYQGDTPKPPFTLLLTSHKTTHFFFPFTDNDKGKISISKDGVCVFIHFLKPKTTTTQHTCFLS
jgi:hypothetical protein